MFANWNTRYRRLAALPIAGIAFPLHRKQSLWNRSICAVAGVLVASLVSVANAHATENYVFILPSLANPYWQTVKQGIEETGKAVGIKPTVLFTTNDQAKEEALNLCQTAIAQHPAIIVICTTTDTITLQCMKEAQKHHIRVGLLDVMIPEATLKKAGVQPSFSIGTDNLIVGETAAKFVASTAKFAAPKVLVLEGPVGNTASTNRVNGFKQELAKRMPTAKIVNSVSADWDRLKAMNMTSDTLTREPNLNIVYAANDTMALGAAAAVRQAKKTKDILVIGVDGVPDARKAILAGNLTASVAQLPYLIGKRSLELARDSVKQQRTGLIEKTPLLVLTKSALESRTDPLFKYVR